MRLDAIKHYSLSFLADFLAHLDATSLKKLFFVGEYWDADSAALHKIIQRFHGRLNLFDVQLVYNFSDFGKGRKWDLRTVFDGTLIQRDPIHAVVCFGPSQALSAFMNASQALTADRFGGRLSWRTTTPRRRSPLPPQWRSGSFLSRTLSSFFEPIRVRPVSSGGMSSAITARDLGCLRAEANWRGWSWRESSSHMASRETTSTRRTASGGPGSDTNPSPMAPGLRSS